jgi:ribokinase
MFDVICMGSSTIDLFMRIKDKFRECLPGDKILIDELDYGTGGGGTNSAVALSRLGCKSAFLGKTGSDHNAERILSELRKENVSVIPVKKSKLRTSFSVILESCKEADRIIYTYKGASNDLSGKDFSMKKLNAKWIYLATHLGKAFKTSERVVEYAKKKGIKVLFNPSEYLARHPGMLKNILKNTDILVLNKHEAQLLTKTSNGFSRLAKLIIKKGVKAIIITDGPHGVYYDDGKQKIREKAHKIKIVSTAGAGDAFTSGFLAGLIRGVGIKQCLKIGMANAESVIKHMGAKSGLLGWKDISRLK